MHKRGQDTKFNYSKRKVLKQDYYEKLYQYKRLQSLLEMSELYL